MQAVSRFVAFALVSSLLMLSVLGADDKDEPAKKDAKKEEPAKKDSTTKLPLTKLPPRKGKLKDLETDKDAAEKKELRKAKVNAEVMAVVEDKKSLRLKLTIPYVKINQGQLQNYYKAQNLQQMLQAQAQLYQLDKVEKEVEWTMADEYKVRMASPPPKFDDKGRPGRYTRKELQELKGNDRLPGYPAEFSDLKTGQIVQLTLRQNKTGRGSIKRGRDAEGDAAADNLPKISLLIILADPKK